MAIRLEGEHQAAGVRLAVVTARFNSFITDKLLDGVLRTVTEKGGDAESVVVAYVPGSLELAVTGATTGRNGPIRCGDLPGLCGQGAYRSL